MGAMTPERQIAESTSPRFKDHEGKVRIPSEAAARLPNRFLAVLWYDEDDEVWRGVFPQLSLFAQAASFEEALADLADQLGGYCRDAVELGLVDELIPRPLPFQQRTKLALYIRWLELRQRVREMLHRPPHDGTPQVRREHLPCGP